MNPRYAKSALAISQSEVLFSVDNPSRAANKVRDEIFRNPYENENVRIALKV